VCPADVLDLTENTSTTLISPAQYREHCFRHIGEYARIAREAGRDLNLHMCGHLKALLPMLNELGVRSFEAFTSPPVGNTRLVDGRRGCPDVCLIGGTNAALWTLPARRIIEELGRDLDALPHHRGLVVTSGGMMPPLAAPDTIRDVCEFVKQYPLAGRGG
jgi:uroporphyrinogen-III decarboxylase